MNEIHGFNASLELQHIYLEVYAERYSHLRTFLESYYCYQHGLVTKQGKPDWIQIFNVGKRTIAAHKIQERKLLVREMMLPLSVIMGHFKTLVRDDEATIENIKMIIDEHLEYVIMTREEYNALVKAGLKETMPIGYYQATDAHYCCINARFDVVGITLLM
ncbi:hypothetical protein [Photobacterium iliopiscarium]|jgi:hypothetical protein|uniref:Uncharacterized protein n=2 Tax=Photobacterium iliopiscarium TaxID=56192 RepID=A0A2T3MLA6_9GAMM|nr:hypothetical protein [Photobacterium iliopiscarium]PST96119.1 hypothetical protein C9I87_06160 [Photobacterium iliopiscarium]PST99563.1 hypothetical protein C9I85_10095 [Photobacterium iliopiscarium]PSV82888.1 hypothetical protein C9J51_10120 [Photobacterium iliopiscarium]PSV97061.1 hypothetical protein C9I88_09715 [Photobacterium iliopiscarium]